MGGYPGTGKSFGSRQCAEKFVREHGVDDKNRSDGGTATQTVKPLSLMTPMGSIQLVDGGIMKLGDNSNVFHLYLP